MSFIVSHFNEPGKALESYVAVGGEGSMMAVNALWDTGSTESLISENIVKMIDPILKSKAKYVTKDTVIESETYAVSLSLSEEITFRDVLVKKADLSEKNVDIIIGMDIISRGDFEIRNYNNLIEFAFRIPPRNIPLSDL
ncbi:MAG: hypothetical protein IKL47_12880 [Clostridia bacterium]|nr:hypothetical protein [Clostridia bacterium]